MKKRIYLKKQPSTYTREAFEDKRLILKALRRVYPELRTRWDKHEVQHLVLEALRTVDMYESVLNNTPAEAVAGAVRSQYGTE